MLFIPVYDTQLGCTSFVIGDESAGIGLVVDPLTAIGAATYVLTAQDLGLSITQIVETHVHADHASLAQDLSALLQIPIALSRHAPADFPFEPLQDGQHLRFGALEVTIWETPGHTADSISLSLADLNRGPTPWVVLTGDSLFVGDVGRPDLADASEKAVEEASRQQFQTVHRLMSLPDYVEVWPSHYGASPCGGLFMNPRPHSTIGYERLYNRMVGLRSQEEFLDYQRRLIKEAPPGAEAIRRQNLGIQSY